MLSFEGIITIFKVLNYSLHCSVLVISISIIHCFSLFALKIFLHAL